jgi:TonB family protein
VDEGEETALNAKKWKFASFFNRVKEQIRQHWHAAEEYGKRDPNGAVYGAKVHLTLVRIRLTRDGSLSSVQLEQGSGVDFLDDVAVQAVKEAQPFPNPPQQLVDPALGLISFQFGFVLDVSGQPRLKLFRYSSM